ncbi:MAG: hypothetical protein RIS41_56 [Actinomycetota bacterium]
MTTGGRDIDALMADLSIDEKASLTTGATMWSTRAVERVGLPSVTVTDGPAGARGPFTPGLGRQVATLCIPCGSALGATFDPDLVEELGRAVGHQTRSKGARVLLAPTVNLHRSPLYGRAFECYSEDPLLSGRLAAAYVRGVQSQGCATTVKHFVGNDAEFERMTIDSVIDDRTLREVYLLPFEIAVRDGGSLGIMTAYNRMNGTFCAEHEWLIRDVLRGEWGFEGFVVTDWFAGFGTEGGARAGLDLEMPAPSRAYGKALAEAVKDGRVDETDLDRAVRTLLAVFDRLGALNDEPIEPQAVDLPEHRRLARRAAASSIVLLRNESVDGASVLPIDPASVTSIAVIGPNAERARIMGGGSAEVLPHHETTIIDALRERFGDQVAIHHATGCSIDKNVPIVDGHRLTTPSGESGFDIAVIDRGSGEHLATLHRPDGRVVVIARQDPGVPISGFTFTARSELRVEHSGRHTMSLVEAGPCRLFVDGRLVIDGFDVPPPGDRFFGLFRQELVAEVDLTADRPHEIVLECDATERQWAHGAEIGLRRVETHDLVIEARDLAARCDVAVVVVGTNNDWESEGHDRTTLDLPGRQVELIRAVAEANARTAVLVNSGAPVDMAWAEHVPAVMQIWFGGQEMAVAVADVLSGDVDPGGRLPTTIPMCIEHTPAFGNFPGEHGQVRYGEGILVGHRWYDTRRIPVRFPFGHGRSYTTFAIGTPTLDRHEIGPRESVSVKVPVTNTGDRTGSHVVQIYVAPRSTTVSRPVQELKGFAKVKLAPGETATTEIRLSPRAFAHWNPGDLYRSELRPSPTGERSLVTDDADGSWQIDAGDYDIRVASSATDVHASLGLTITATERFSPKDAV